MVIDELRKVRIDKIEKLRRASVDPFPSKSWRSCSVSLAIDNFETWSAEKKMLVLAGRIMAIREHGGSTFIDIEDGTGRMQAFLKKDVIGDKEYDLFKDTIDIGDFIEVHGFLFLTKKFEKTLQVEKYRILAKSIMQLPEKWHGLQDTDERFRKRYLDLIFNEEVRGRFQMRSKIIQAIRDFMNGHDFMEVQTPALQMLYGGASARPFKTHMHALDMDLYLRIAPELFLKRLLVGGFEKVFEFTTNFRNEGMDREHNPEFSAMEWYAAYKDLDWAMDFTEDMFEQVVERVLGGTKVKYENMEIDFKKPFQRAAFNDLLKKHASIDFDYADEDNFRAKADELGLKIEKHATKGILADEIFKKVVRPKLIDPTYVTAWPVEILPLAKRIGDTAYVDAFQFFAGGFELIKAFTELNDPIDQRERFAAQEKNRAKGDEEAQRMDEDFVEALEYGMPPAAGWGLGIDRLVALLTNSHSIREVILFPLMRPKE